MNENKRMFLPMLLITLLIVAFAALGKDTLVVNSLVFNNYNIIFPFTFIVTAYMVHCLGARQTQKAIHYSIFVFLFFIVSLMFTSIFKSNESTYYFRASLEFVFTPKSILLGNIGIAYPEIPKLVLFLSSYYISQTIFINLYKALKETTPKIFAYLINYIIAYILNVLVYVGGINLLLMIDNKIAFNDFIVSLTSGFLGALATCIVTTIIYSLITLLIKKDNSMIFKTAP